MAVSAAAARPVASKRGLLALSSDTMQSLQPARVFSDAVDSGSSGDQANKPAPLQITSISFDDAGERCVTAGEDDVFTVYDARKGKKVRTLYSKKYGIDHARFTHRRENIIHASTKGDHAIRYHSMHDNKYLSYFQGHTGMVRSLQMNPADDTFISAGDDGTVRLWDLRTSSCRGVVNNIGGPTIAAFDSSGVVFAVACSQSQTVMLYDSTSLDNAPFAHAALIDVALDQGSRPLFTSVTFSNDGNHLLVGTSSNTHYVLDAYDLTLLRRLEGHQGLGSHSGEEVSWTADSKWVLSGSADGTVAVWDLGVPEGAEKLEPPTGRTEPAPVVKPAAVLRAGTGPLAPSRAVSFNPRFGMMAVGGEELSFWLPPQPEGEEGW